MKHEYKIAEHNELLLMQTIKAHKEVPRQYGVELSSFRCLIFWPLQSNNFLSATVSWVHLGGLFHSPISLQDFPYFLQNIEKNADKFNFTHKNKGWAGLI